MVQEFELEKGATLYREGQNAQNVYLIKKGKLITDFNDSYSQGETLGFFDCALREAYSTTVCAAEHTVVNIIPYKEMQKMQDSMAWKLTMASVKKLDDRPNLRWT